MLRGLTMLALFQLFVFGKKHCLLRGIFVTVAGGLLALLLLSLAEPLLGFALPLTEGTALFCSVLGLPGVVFLALEKLLLGL